MTGLCRLLVAGLSQLIESNARDAVIGDLTELNLGVLRSVRELSGLIARQQAPLWKDWQPWLALLGIAGLVCIRLNLMAGDLVGWASLYARTYRVYGVPYQSGLSPTLELIASLSVATAVILWSWTAGFAFVSLARKTAVVSGIILCVVWLGWNCLVLTSRLLVLPSWSFALLLAPSVLFFVPAVLGAVGAFRGSDLSRKKAILLVVLTVGLIALVTWTSGWRDVAIERWSEGAIHGGTPWYQRLLPYLLLSSPSAWIAARGRRYASTCF